MARKKLRSKKMSWLDMIHAPTWLCAILFFIFIFRIPSLFEPFSYGDEMIYLDLGESIRRGLTLYKDIHDNKPPLLYFTAAIAGNVFWFRAILMLWMMATTVIFWRLAEKIFPKNTKIQKVATVIFAIFTTIPLLEGQTANAELFMLAPTLLGFLLLYDNNSRSNTPIKLFLSGFFFSVATHFKVPAVFDMGAVAFLWILSLKSFKPKQLLEIFKNGLYFLAGFASLLFAFMLWYASKNSLDQYIVAAFMQNVGYLSSWRPDDKVDPFFVRNLPLIMRGTIVLVGLFGLFIAKKKLSKSYGFLTAWTLFSLFAITLSERPYPHYLIQVMPAAALLAGLLVAGRTVTQSLTVIPLFLTILVPVYFKFWHYKSLPYYQNFIEFSVGQKSREEYFARFGGNTNRNYAISEFVTQNTRPEDYVFVWGDDAATIYALSRRLPPLKFVASYHINDFSSPEEVITKLQQNKPALIVILPNTGTFIQLDLFIQNSYYELTTIDGAQIFKYSEPLSRLLKQIE